MSLVLPLLATAALNGAPTDCGPAPAVRSHIIQIGGRKLAYRSEAGLLPVRDEASGRLQACVFFVAYRVAPKAGSAPRPVSFIWNGGPGANSSYLEMEAFGPRRIVNAPDPTQADPKPLKLEDNPSTLLDQSDLVFVDAPGTGFSRAVDDRAKEELYNVTGDAGAFAQAVRAWQGRFGARRAPVYLIGESYGVWRAAAVAELLEGAGDKVAGTMLISGGIPVGPVLAPEVKTALLIPNRTAAAHHFHKLAPDLQADFGKATSEAARWAENVYAPALQRADSLGAQERDAMVEGLARYTGLDASKIDRATLVVPRRALAKALLADRGETLGTLDIRVTHPQPGAEREALTRRYLKNEIGYPSKEPYVFDAEEEVGQHWGYNQAGPNPPAGPSPEAAKAHPTAAAAWAAAYDGPPGGSQPWLLRALKLDPAMRVLIVAGWYDSLNSCAGNAYLVAHLPATIRSNFTARCYRAGHMIYRDAGPRTELRETIRRFYAGKTP